jgi:16S rRNA (guanine966-N2)-methyltransferase
MRVIAGRYKGRRLGTPSWTGLRPTSDKLRETLFNILAAEIAGARVLDGFAGTGAIGIEALSRGAAHVTFVERDGQAAALIARNLERCGIADGYAIIRATFAAAVAGHLRNQSFDLIVLDPPYEVADPAAEIERAERILAPGGLVVLEHARRRTAPAAAGRLVPVREVFSGDSALALYRVADGLKPPSGLA